MFGQTNFAFSGSSIRFDKKTLRDPSSIVKQVVKLRTKDTIRDAEELSSQKEDNLLNNGSYSAEDDPEFVGLTES